VPALIEIEFLTAVALKPIHLKRAICPILDRFFVYFPSTKRVIVLAIKGIA
jgi:hypothetical protein